MSFILISDVTQTIKEELFGPGWLSLGVAKIPRSNISRERYFFLLLRTLDKAAYIEEYVDFPEYFVEIKDENLWNDLYQFFFDKGLITIAVGKEIKVAF